MADFVKFIKKLFSPASKTGTESRVPYVHEIIERNEEDSSTYELWKGSERFERMRDFLRMEYRKNLEEENVFGATFYTLDQASSKGFYLNFRQDFFSIKEFQHFFDFLKEKVLELDYKPSMSDVRTYNRPEKTERIERHYLKPDYKPVLNEKLDQQYGNITIQHVLFDELPHHIKFICNSYHDGKYMPSKDYHNLIEYILDLEV